MEFFGVVAFGAVGPALLDAFAGPDFVIVLGKHLRQSEDILGKLDAGGVERSRLVSFVAHG